MSTTKSHIEALIKKASESEDAENAVNFAAAAVNCANAFSAMAISGQQLS